MNFHITLKRDLFLVHATHTHALTHVERNTRSVNTYDEIYFKLT